MLSSLRIFILLLLFQSLTSYTFSQQAFVQEKRDYVWLFGYASDAMVPGFGGSVINFKEEPPLIYEEFRPMNLSITAASICDTAGQLLFYTNGIKIDNANHVTIENGAGLNPGEYADDFQEEGYRVPQGALFLPDLGNSNQYYLLHTTLEYSIPNVILTHVSSLRYSLIDLEGDILLGKAIEKNIELITDTLNVGELTATRHANGRDWWVLVAEYDSPRIHRHLLTPNGFVYEGMQELETRLPLGLAQGTFAPYGSKFVRYSIVSIGTEQYIDIFDFDRCTGLLSNQQTISYIDNSPSPGAAISPNSRFLYISSFEFVYQYDLWASDIESTRQTIAVYDGFLGPLSTTFFLAQLAPNNKIYISANNTVNYLHVIHNPNASGALSEIEQHGVKLPTLNRFSIPNAPYYGLGPLDGSSCDTLGLDNHPRAAFLYRLDDLQVTFTDYSRFDPQEWLWDFGDGQISQEQNPTHTFDTSGVYTVCLTVTNDNAMNTQCQEIVIVTTNLGPTLSDIPDLKIYPNPASDWVSLAWSASPPANSYWVLYNQLGQEVLRYRLLQGTLQYTFALSNLPTGPYFWRVQTPDSSSYSGKLLLTN